VSSTVRGQHHLRKQPDLDKGVVIAVSPRAFISHVDLLMRNQGQYLVRNALFKLKLRAHRTHDAATQLSAGPIL